MSQVYVIYNKQKATATIPNANPKSQLFFLCVFVQNFNQIMIIFVFMKKISTLTILLLTIIISNAQLVSYQKIDSLSIADLNSLINTLGYTGFIVPEYPVDVYRIMYNTEYKGGFTEISGVLAVPKNTECKAPLVSYQHGTTSLKYNVPSYNGSEKSIVIMYASLGNIVCASDYIGLGASTETMHPYMHAYSQAHSTINLMRTVREIDENLDFNMSNQIFLFGYSQGGFATAATLKHIEQDYSTEFTITASAPMSGPYNMGGAQFDMVASGLPYSTPGYLPYVILGYQSVYGNLYNNTSEIFKSPYDVTMPNLFSNHNYGIGYISSQMPSSAVPTDILIDSVFQEIKNNPNHVFRQALQDNDFLSWTPQSHMKLFYCNGDDQVTYLNATIADSVWNENGAPNIESEDFGNLDHGGCFPYALLNGKAYMESFSNNGVEIIVEYNLASNSFIVDVVDDNIADFDIEWQDGSTASSISNIQAETIYVVSLTHKTKGCTNSKSFEKDDIYNSINNIENVYFTISPNPTNKYLNIEVSDKQEKNIYIVNTLGKTVLKQEINNNSKIDISNLAKGLYFIGLNNSFVKHKFVIK